VVQELSELKVSRELLEVRAIQDQRDQRDFPEHKEVSVSEGLLERRDYLVHLDRAEPKVCPVCPVLPVLPVVREVLAVKDLRVFQDHLVRRATRAGRESLALLGIRDFRDHRVSKVTPALRVTQAPRASQALRVSAFPDQLGHRAGLERTELWEEQVTLDLRDHRVVLERQALLEYWVR